MPTNAPRKLIGKCVLGAVFAPEGGFIGETHARARVQEDSNNLLSTTFYQKANDGTISARLKSVPQAGGGIIPEVNPFLGAPMATFLEGGIGPGAVNSVLNLIKGPSSSAITVFTDPIQGYNPKFSSQGNYGGVQGDGSLDPKFLDPNRTDMAHRAQYPTIPSTTDNIFGESTVQTTYNVWRLVNVDSATLKNQVFVQDQGPQRQSGYSGPWARQSYTADNSCNITVYAANVSAQLTRFFSSSMDMVYSGNAQLFYPPVVIAPATETTPAKTLTIPPRTIQAQGGDNCGFQIRIRHSAVAQGVNKTASQLNGGINLFFGSPTLPISGNYITNFSIEWLPDKPPVLGYYHPIEQKWKYVPLHGGGIMSSSGGEVSVYIHFNGPQMMIGFSSDMNSWQTFVPPDGDRSNGQFFYPKLPKNNYVSLIFDHMTATFNYGPIAFNNYHPEYITSQSDIKNQYDLGIINTYFQTPQTHANQLNPTDIDNHFAANAFVGGSSDPNNMESTPTYYGDWRSPNARPVYKEFSRSTDATTGDINVSGYLQFNTTIEGPQFIHIRNSQIPSSTLSTTSVTGGNGSSFSTFTPSKTPFIRPLDPWGDISEFLTGFQVDYQLEGDNRSRLKAIATITLVGIAATQEGRDILDAAVDNALAITVGAGYGDAANVFQGICVSTETTRGPKGPITIIKAEDFITNLLERIPFRNTLYFGSMQYGSIIRTAIDMSGFSSWYVQQIAPIGPETDDVIFNNFNNAITRRLGLTPVEGSLALNILHADPRKMIMEIIEPALKIIVGVNAIPVFYWDEQYQMFVLAWRNDTSYRDKLICYGEELDNGGFALLPYEGTHGVLVDAFREVTHQKNLQSGISAYGQNYYGGVITHEEIDPNAYSEAAYQTLLHSLPDNPASSNLGYVGARVIKIIPTNQVILPDQTSMDLYCNTVFKATMRQTYKSIHFKCNVDEPLNHIGTFAVATFVPGITLQDAPMSDVFYYKSVSYDANFEENLFTAEVDGERFPSFALRGEEDGRPKVTLNG